MYCNSVLNNIRDTQLTLFLHPLLFQGTLLPFVAHVIEREVQSCDSERLLFRRNSLATKLITCASHIIGHNAIDFYVLS